MVTALSSSCEKYALITPDRKYLCEYNSGSFSIPLFTTYANAQYYIKKHNLDAKPLRIRTKVVKKVDK